MAPQLIKRISKDDEIGQIINKHFTTKYCEEFVLVGEDETCVPVYYTKFADDLKNFEIRDSDIFVCTFPRTGTTWTQEMVWLISNNLNYEGAKTDLITRFPFLELSITHDVEKLIEDMKTPFFYYAKNSVDYASQKPDPRFIKTHLPFSLLPDQIKNGTKSPKMIYVIRDSRDACISYHHHGRLFQEWSANIEDHCKVFMANKIAYGSFWKHIFGFWDKRNLPNLLFITYEDMKRDLASVIKKVAIFLDKKLTDEEIAMLCKHLSFKAMKQNDAVNLEPVIRPKRENKIVPEDGAFIRSGVVGKYKEEISPEMIQVFNAWIKENIAGTSLAKEYPYLL